MKRTALIAFAPFVCLVVLAVTSATPAESEVPRPTKPDARKLRVVVCGAHPDDPESGCGGLIALLTSQGHEVVVGYLTCFRGDRKVGKEPEAQVRRREATAACQALGAKPHFFDYAHEKLVADTATVDAVAAWLKEVKPDVVVTHWPLDTHPNHHVTSSLVWQCFLRDSRWGLYFFEVMTDQQSLVFRPELYLDIGSVRELKLRALDSHRSQTPDAIWKAHDAMHRRRGAEAGVEYAEAFVRAESARERPKLPLGFLGAQEITEAGRSRVYRLRGRHLESTSHMPNGLFYHVGIDATAGGRNAPCRRDGSFCYVPISETAPSGTILDHAYDEFVPFVTALDCTWPR